MKKSQKKTLKKPQAGQKNSNRRNKIKYPALNPGYNLKIRTEELLDIQEYARTIPDDMIDPKTGKNVKEFLNSFVEEYVNANFKHKGPKLIKKVAQKRERYRANNYRNNDIYSKEKAQGALNYIEDIKDKSFLEEGERASIEEVVDANLNFYNWNDDKKE